MLTKRIIWGFMLENTYFTEFDAANHQIIEDAHNQRKHKPASYYITINDSNLKTSARIYFGVAQVHLRMPGTRYYVKRKIIRQSSQFDTLALNTLLSKNICHESNCWCLYVPGQCGLIPLPQSVLSNSRNNNIVYNTISNNAISSSTISHNVILNNIIGDHNAANKTIVSNGIAGDITSCDTFACDYPSKNKPNCSYTSSNYVDTNYIDVNYIDTKYNDVTPNYLHNYIENSPSECNYIDGSSSDCKYIDNNYSDCNYTDCNYTDCNSTDNNSVVSNLTNSNLKNSNLISSNPAVVYPNVTNSFDSNASLSDSLTGNHFNNNFPVWNLVVPSQDFTNTNF